MKAIAKQRVVMCILCTTGFIIHQCCTWLSYSICAKVVVEVGTQFISILHTLSKIAVLELSGAKCRRTRCSICLLNNWHLFVCVLQNSRMVWYIMSGELTNCVHRLVFVLSECRWKYTACSALLLQTLISLEPRVSESSHVIGFFSPRIGDKQLPK